MPSGAILSTRNLVAAAQREDRNLAAINDTLGLLQASAARNRGGGHPSPGGGPGPGSLVQDVDVLFMDRLAGGGLVTAPLAQGMISAAIVTSDLGCPGRPAQ